MVIAQPSGMTRCVFAAVQLLPAVLRLVVNELFAVIIEDGGRIAESSILSPLATFTILGNLDRLFCSTANTRIRHFRAHLSRYLTQVRQGTALRTPPTAVSLHA